MEQLLFVLKKGGPTSYLLAGFRLAARWRPDYRFDEIGQCDRFPEPEVADIAERLDHSGWLALALWERCGRLPGFAEVITKSRWRSIAAVAARRYFEFLIGVVYWDLSERSLRQKWWGIVQQIPRVEALLAATPGEYQVKAMECIADWLAWWDDPPIIRQRLPAGCEMLRRLAAPPFLRDDVAGRALFHFLELEPGLMLPQFLAAPDRALQALEGACRRENDARLIGRGLEQLTRIRRGRFALEALLGNPKRLCRAAKTLGSLSAPARNEVARACESHPFFEIDPLTAPVRELCAKIVANRRGRIENPIPARLSAWLRGEIELSPLRLEKYQRALVEKFELTRLSLVEETALERMKRGLHLPGHLDAGSEHALHLLASIPDNRRGLRKFLKAHWAGDCDYLARHPATAAWRRKHPAIAHAVWDQGIPFESGSISIEVERDPFEVLKLGTYVGSCLALGGICSDSSVAALLDANKRVLYARDHLGRVVARQLVAISDTDQLVCFAVYPLSAGKEIRSLFRKYDFAFAEAPGVPVYEPAKTAAGYEISCVLSVAWWDDDSWDFKVENEAN